MTFSQTDADRLEFLKYAVTFPGAQGSLAAIELAAFKRTRGAKELKEMQRHSQVCAALIGSMDEVAR